MLERVFLFLVDLIKSIFSFLKILLRSRFFLKKHKTSDQSCIILGNGPSLKTVLSDYPEQLKNHTLFCVNKFPDTPAFTQLKPRYFSFVAREYYIPGPVKKLQEVRDKIIEQLVANTTWPLTVYCPSEAKSKTAFIQKLSSNPNIDICFYNITPAEGLSSLNRFFMKKGWGMPRPHNVLIPSILNMVNAGFKTIHVVGADHSWLPQVSVNEKNEALINQKHFYDADTSKSDKMYVSAIGRPRRLHEILEKFVLSFRAYFEIEEYAKSLGCKIYNCTKGSYIDAFERKDLEQVLQEAVSSKNKIAQK